MTKAEEEKKGKEPDDEVKELSKKVEMLKISIKTEEGKAKRMVAEVQNTFNTIKAEEEVLKKKIIEKDPTSETSRAFTALILAIETETDFSFTSCGAIKSLIFSFFIDLI